MMDKYPGLWWKSIQFYGEKVSRFMMEKYSGLWWKSIQVFGGSISRYMKKKFPALKGEKYPGL